MSNGYKANSDINVDGYVNMFDMAEFAAQEVECNDSANTVNNDRVILIS